MQPIFISVIGLLAFISTTQASPVDKAPTSASLPIPTPAVTDGPRLVARFSDPVETLTTTAVGLSCTFTADPDINLPANCTCNNGLILPATPSVSGTETYQDCPQTAWTLTSTLTSTNPFPFTSTAPNNAVVAYESSGEALPTTAWGYGSSTTIQQGTSISLEINPTSYVNAGNAASAEAQSSLYTAVSNALTSGCPTPSNSATVTACPSIPAVTGIAYMAEGNLDVEYDGKLETSIEEVSISTEDGYYALINGIASGVATSAHNPNNSKEEFFYQPGDCLDSPVCWSGDANFTNIPATMQSIMTVQTNETNGAVILQNLGVAFSSVQGSSAFGCSEASLVLSGLAAAAAAAGILAPAEEGALAAGVGVIGSLSLGSAGSFARFGLSMACDAPKF